MKKIAMLAFLLFCASAFAAEDVVTRVLKSHNIYDLYGSRKPNDEQRWFVEGLSDELIKIILTEPTNERAWQALHKFRPYTDGGISQMFSDACFNALLKRPKIFYDRYMAGDKKALDRAEDSAWGFSEVDSQSSNKEDINYLYNNLDQIAKIKSSDPRHSVFVQRFKKAIKEREKETEQ